MSKLIVGFLIIAAIYGGMELFRYYERLESEESSAKKEAAASAVSPQHLSGLPYNLETLLAAAQGQGAEGLRKFLKTYGANIQDPRKAWIELDYVVALTRENPAEARRIFAEVKERTGPSSPVWKRIKELEKTYE
jgi:hypothetical protein